MPDTRDFNLFLDIITIALTCSKLPKIFSATLNHAHQIKCDLLSCYLHLMCCKIFRTSCSTLSLQIPSWPWLLSFWLWCFTPRVFSPQKGSTDWISVCDMLFQELFTEETSILRHILDQEAKHQNASCKFDEDIEYEIRWVIFAMQIQIQLAKNERWEMTSADRRSKSYKKNKNIQTKNKQK